MVYFKGFLSTIVLLTYSFLGLVVCLFKPFDPRPTIFLARYFMSPICQRILGIKVVARNIHFAQEARPCVIVANHQNNFDVLLLGGYLPLRTSTIGKKQLLYIPLFGLLFWLSDHVLVDRGRSQRAKKSLDKAVESIKSKGKCLFIFPEGTRSNGRGLLKFKKGAFYMAINAQIPLVVTVMSDYTKHVKIKKWFNAGTVILEMLPPIETKGMTVHDVDALSDKVRQMMLETLERHNKELSRAEVVA